MSKTQNTGAAEQQWLQTVLPIRATVFRRKVQENKGSLSVLPLVKLNNWLNGIGIKKASQANRISKIFCGHLSSLKQCTVDASLCSPQQCLTVGLWQVLCVVCFSFTDVQFFSLYLFLQCSPCLPFLSPSASLPADMVKINGSSILWKVWCLLMKSYLLWVTHLIAAGTTTCRRTVSPASFMISLTHKHAHLYGHSHSSKLKCVVCRLK